MRLEKGRKRKLECIKKRLHVHCKEMIVPANSLFFINGFTEYVPVGEYLMPKHFLKSGVVIAENLISIRENLLGE